MTKRICTDEVLAIVSRYINKIIIAYLKKKLALHDAVLKLHLAVEAKFEIELF